MNKRIFLILGLLFFLGFGVKAQQIYYEDFNKAQYEYFESIDMIPGWQASEGVKEKPIKSGCLSLQHSSYESKGWLEAQFTVEINKKDDIWLKFEHWASLRD